MWAQRALRQVCGCPTHPLFSRRGRDSARLPVLWVDLFPAPGCPEVIRQRPAFKRQNSLVPRAGFRTREQSLPKDRHSRSTPGGLRPPVPVHLSPSSPLSPAQRWRGWLGWEHRTPFSAFLHLLGSVRSRAKREISQCPTRKPQPFSVWGRVAGLLAEKTVWETMAHGRSGRSLSMASTFLSD